MGPVLQIPGDTDPTSGHGQSIRRSHRSKPMVQIRSRRLRPAWTPLVSPLRAVAANGVQSRSNALLTLSGMPRGWWQGAKRNGKSVSLIGSIAPLFCRLQPDRIGDADETARNHRNGRPTRPTNRGSWAPKDLSERQVEYVVRAIAQGIAQGRRQGLELAKGSE